jgi:transcriptional regulator with XRE-family HTH domain
MNVRRLVAWNLRRLRVARGLSQETLAADASVDRAYVGRLERSLENPTIGVLDRLMNALDADMLELFVKPKAGASEPKPLKGGRKKSRIKRSGK